MTGQCGTRCGIACGTADRTDAESALVDFRTGRGTLSAVVRSRPSLLSEMHAERVRGECGTDAESPTVAFRTRCGTRKTPWTDAMRNAAPSRMRNPHRAEQWTGRSTGQYVTTFRYGRHPRRDVCGRGRRRPMTTGHVDHRVRPSHVKFTSGFTSADMPGGSQRVRACACAGGDRIRPSQPVTGSDSHGQCAADHWPPSRPPERCFARVDRGGKASGLALLAVEMRRHAATLTATEDSSTRPSVPREPPHTD